MEYRVFLLLLAILPLSMAIQTPIYCPSSAKLNATMNACLDTGQGATFSKTGLCPSVLCTQKSADIPKICLPSAMLDKGIDLCLNQSMLAEIYGTMNCSSVRCDIRITGNRTGSLNKTNSTGIVDTVMALGSKYGSTIGAVLGG